MIFSHEEAQNHKDEGATISELLGCSFVVLCLFVAKNQRWRQELPDLISSMNPFPKRIAFFCDSLQPSGVGHVMETLARHLARRGFELFLVCAEGEGADALWSRLAPHIRDGARLTLRSGQDAEARELLVSKLREWEIEVFHNHIGILWEGDFGTLAAREAGVPLVVATEHLPAFAVWGDKLSRKREINRHLDMVFAVSNSVRRAHLEAGLVFPFQIEVVENGVELPINFEDSGVTRQSVRDELGLSMETPLLLFCGRLVEQKDPHALFDSFALSNRTDAHLLVVGDGHLREHCENRAREVGVDNRVHFLGNRSDVARLMAGSDAFILPSRFEGLPLAVLEAMAAHLPVVACDVFGTRDCVAHGATGFLAPLFDLNSLARGIERALGEEGSSWGKAGHARFCAEFEASAFAARQEAAYNRAWQKRGVAQSKPKRIVWVFAWLVVGGEETEVRLLAGHLDPAKYALEVVACFHKDGMPDQTHAQLESLGVPVDRAPYWMPFDETVEYLSHRLRGADLVIASQNVRDVIPALERIEARGETVPPLIEHGGLVEEALGPKRFTSRYIGVCDSIRDLAASLMPGREHHALSLPSMVDVREFCPSHRGQVRRQWHQEFGWDEGAFVAGWVGRLDRKKRVEDFVRAASLVLRERPGTRFLVVGGPDAFMPEYERELHELARELGLRGALAFLGDRADVPRLLGGMDALCWLSRNEGMPHIISEAGAARLPVVATRDNGSLEQIEDTVSGLFVEHEAPDEVAACLIQLMDDADWRAKLGGNLRCKVEREYSVEAVARKWQEVFEEVLDED